MSAFTELARFALGKFFALISLLRDQVARLFARARRKQHAHQSAHTESYQEKTDLGTHIVRHDCILRRKVSMAKRMVQYGLTSIWTGVRLLFCCIPPPLAPVDFGRELEKAGGAKALAPDYRCSSPGCSGR